jgi:hypothetical protein
MNNCITGFKTVKPQLCRYFANGYCVKGESCSFSHIPNNSVSTCRNGQRCGYLANGVCSFFHPGVGVQQPRFNNQSVNFVNNQNGFGTNQRTPFNNEQSPRWCRWMEDCNRVPNCPFAHYEQDFPPMSKNNPPENQRKQSKESHQNC